MKPGKRRTGAGSGATRDVAPPVAAAGEVPRAGEGVVVTFDNVTRMRRAQERSRRLATVVADSNDAVILIDLQGRIEAWNRGAQNMYGWSPEEALRMNVRDIVPAEAVAGVSDLIRRLLAGEDVASFNTQRLTRDGRVLDVGLTATAVRDEARQIVEIATTERDITARKGAELERETSVAFLRLVNEAKGTSDLVHKAASFFRARSGCEAVGIRLRDGEDYPYCEAYGFSEAFIRTENSLCARDAAGQVLRDNQGYPIQACMCGNVICGRFDASKPFFTARGSFWTNGTTELLATTSDADRQARTRNRCNGEGYESVALIALRVGEDRLGLLQLNDKRKNRFTPGSIAMWERLAEYLAVALAKTRAEEALRRSEGRWNAAIENFSEGAIIATEDEQVIYWNPAARRMHGFTSETEGLEPLTNTPITFQLWTPDGGHMLALDEWPMRRIKRGEAVRNLELRVRRPDQGWEKRFAYSGNMVETAGGERLIFLSVCDLTELRKAEEQVRRQVEGLREANEELARFNEVAVGRELRMIELKKQVNDLNAKAGRPAPYEVEE